MKAAVIYKYGGADVIGVEEVAEPQMGQNEVILQVRSASLNHLDIWVRKGRPGAELQLSHILGSDAAGVVIDRGSETHGFNIGDEVILNPGLS